MYNADQWKVMGILASELPKRAIVRTKEIVAHFRRRENADRIVRNSYRKLKDEDHVEIVERGEYRLTPAGVKFYNKMKAEGFKPNAKKGAADKPKKTAKKKVTKKAKKKVAKAPKARKVTKKKVTKKAAKPKKAPAKKAAKKKTKAKSKIAGLMQKAAASKPKPAPKPAAKAPEPEAKSGNGNGVPGDKPAQTPATPLRW
jgi:hypothetical protein